MSSNTTAALALAEEKMEDLLQKEYTHADLSNGNHEQVNINEAGQAGGIYHRIWVVQDDTPISNTKTIIVTVEYMTASKARVFVPFDLRILDSHRLFEHGFKGNP